jgi:glyoxalase family protein
MQLLGIHHVSALTAQAERNVAFYTDTVGLRLVKKTVNQDDITSYHLFYGDERGRPGTELTFFDIPHLAPLRPGCQSISAVGLRVPTEAWDYWRQRLADFGVEQEDVRRVGPYEVLPFRDFEGQRLVLVGDEGQGAQGGTPWEKSPVPAAFAVRGLGPVWLTVRDAEVSLRTLTDLLGFELLGVHRDEEKREFFRLSTGLGGPGAEVFVLARPDLPRERLGSGGVHHVAFRVPNQEQHEAWLHRLEAAGVPSSGIVERYYFRSIYFREPNGILYELATDGPGFTVDEDVDRLGEELALPPYLEPYRAEIEATLRPLPTQR